MVHRLYMRILRCWKKAGRISGHSNHVCPFNEISRDVLYLTAFLAYGLCDSMSAAYMMMVRGVGAELNPVMRYIFMENGVYGLIMFKVWAMVVILATINLVRVKSKECMTWTVAGFLLSLTFGGILATLANLSKAFGTSFPLSSLEILLLFVISIVTSIILGDILDARQQKNITNKPGNTNK